MRFTIRIIFLSLAIIPFFVSAQINPNGQKPCYIPTENKPNVPWARPQLVPKPPFQGIASCEWDYKKNQYICIGTEGSTIGIPLHPRYWSESLKTILNHPHDFLNPDHAKFFYFEPKNDVLKYVGDDLANEYIKHHPIETAPPARIISPKIPLANLRPGELKPVPNWSPSHMALQVAILNTLRPAINGNLITFPNGTPFQKESNVTIYPKGYIDNDYTIKYADRGFPSMKWKDHLVIAVNPQGFRSAQPPLDPLSPVLTQPAFVPAGPGSTATLAANPSIMDSIRKAVDDGTIQWQIYIEFLKLSLGGDSRLNSNVHLLTNKDGSQTGLLIIFPDNSKISYIFTDEKDAAGNPGKDGIPETVRMYFLNPDGTIKEITVTVAPKIKS